MFLKEETRKKEVEELNERQSNSIRQLRLNANTNKEKSINKLTEELRQQKKRNKQITELNKDLFEKMRLKEQTTFKTVLNSFYGEFGETKKEKGITETQHYNMLIAELNETKEDAKQAHEKNKNLIQLVKENKQQIKKLELELETLWEDF